MSFQYAGDDWLNEIFKADELTSMVEEKGKAAEEAAKANASEHEVTGAFKESIKGELMRSKKGRPWYRVTADDPAALSIEFGTARSQGHRDLGRAIDAIGGE